jgi:hypothetical protein
METNKIVQRLSVVVDDNYQLAEKYYSLLSELNGLRLTQREVQLVAFTAMRGNMSYTNIREDFCKKYGTTSPTINNIISKLKGKGVFVKDKGKVKVNPVILLNFSLDVILQISLGHRQVENKYTP